MATEPSICPTCGQPVSNSERRVREAIRQALDDTGTSQIELANALGVTQKHVSMVLSGKSGLSFDLAERALAVLGRRLQVLAAVDPKGGTDE
jgi:plasmid maintenance system antidote protein VapI